ncbi:MAG TPA: hypothetical protein VF846_02585 [Thermoanaerobaculia bacterium]
MIAETVRRHLTNGMFVSFAIVIALIAIGVSQYGQPGSAWPGFAVLLAVVTGAGVIGPEFSSGTLQLILVKPINRAVYLLSRVAGVVLLVWSVSAIAALCEIAGRALDGEVPWSLIGTALVNSMGDTLLVCALLALFGTFTRAYFNVALYFALQLTLALLVGLARRKFTPAIAQAVVAVEQNLFPDTPPRFDAEWLLLVASNAAIALVLASFIFRRREVPYGAE